MLYARIAAHKLRGIIYIYIYIIFVHGTIKCHWCHATPTRVSCNTNISRCHARAVMLTQTTKSGNAQKIRNLVNNNLLI